MSKARRNSHQQHQKYNWKQRPSHIGSVSRDAGFCPTLQSGLPELAAVFMEYVTTSIHPELLSKIPHAKIGQRTEFR
jgi:hypothetical protein